MIVTGDQHLLQPRIPSQSLQATERGLFVHPWSGPRKQPPGQWGRLNQTWNPLPPIINLGISWGERGLEGSLAWGAQDCRAEMDFPAALERTQCKPSGEAVQE